MKSLLLFPLLLASCATPSGPSTGPSTGATPDHTSHTDAERLAMQHKLIGFQEKYDRFDHDGDGYLTPNEISEGLTFEKVEGITPAEVPKIMAYYDTNRDGRISLSEINAGYEAGPESALRAHHGH
jgi:hypothetical protein